ncbi:MAG: sulfatase-like hydrolase/transferase [Anaerolineales bacterium]|nr:sulfatase-like hydrolase/transferase [Anaerolineales bacterium]
MKLASFVPVAALTRRSMGWTRSVQPPGRPNIIIFVFDAWSAFNVSLYGYGRETMPNLARFAERAAVYHHHYTTGTFTPPGTASLLTGTYPWSHRAFQLGSGIIDRYADKQIFSVLKDAHATCGYSQNKLVDKFLFQMEESLDAHIPIGSFSAQHRYLYNLPIFKNDGQVAFASFEDNIFQEGGGFDASLFFGPAFRTKTLYDRTVLTNLFQQDYPRGVPDSAELFLLEEVVDGALNTLEHSRQPALVYMHFFPPHEPYTPKAGCFQKFRNDTFISDISGPHPLSLDNKKKGTLRAEQRFYDEYLLSWDDEFGRVYDYLDASGLLDNSYIFITSDHGQIHDRGESGHMTSLLFEPLMHVPLVVSRPGQKVREDIYTNTSHVDLLPTIAALSGNPIPEWAEGEVLPGLGGSENIDRSIFVLDAKSNSSFMPLRKYSLSLTRSRFRLTRYQYPQYEGYEFYDLDADPGEKQDLYGSLPTAARDMQAEMLDRISDVNQQYMRK